MRNSLGAAVLLSAAVMADGCATADQTVVHQSLPPPPLSRNREPVMRPLYWHFPKACKPVPVALVDKISEKVTEACAGLISSPSRSCHIDIRKLSGGDGLWIDVDQVQLNALKGGSARNQNKDCTYPPDELKQCILAAVQRVSGFYKENPCMPMSRVGIPYTGAWSDADLGSLPDDW